MQARRWEALPIVLLTGLVSLLALREIFLFLEVRDAPAAAVLHPPLVLYWGPVLAGTLGVGLVALIAALRRGDARPVRIFFVIAFLALVVDIFFLPASRLPPIVTSDMVAESALEQARARVVLGGGPGLLPDTLEPFESALAEGIAPPYLDHGDAVDRWTMVLRHPCDAAVQVPEDQGVGTIFYCLSADRRQGWLTVVGTGGRLVGPPAMAVTLEGPVQVPLKAMVPPIDAQTGPEIPSIR